MERMWEAGIQIREKYFSPKAALGPIASSLVCLTRNKEQGKHFTSVQNHSNLSQSLGPIQLTFNPHILFLENYSLIYIGESLGSSHLTPEQSRINCKARSNLRCIPSFNKV